MNSKPLGYLSLILLILTATWLFLAIWDLSGVDEMSVWFYAVNPNGGFQNHSPWIRLGNDDGFYEWHPNWDILNQALGQWVEFTIPIDGNSTWSRTVFGSPSLDRIHYIEIHADTWGAGFTIWMDGLRFDPPLTPFTGDLNYDGRVDLSDLAELIAHYGMTSGASWEDGDLTGDGAVDLTDLATLLGSYGEVCQ